MRIVRLQIEQFRNYASQTVVFSDHDVQLFIGPNGSGKTNVLEAVSVLSLGKSCRGKEEQDIVQWGAGFYRLKAEIVSDVGTCSRMEIVSELTPRRRKAAFLNDVRLAPTSLIGTLPTVIFLPQDLELFSGAPADRRRFLDQLLSQADPAFVPAFAAYQKVLKQRSALLRQIADGSQPPAVLDLWDREVAGKGAPITLARLELLATLGLSFASEMAGLGESWEEVTLQYERKTTGHTKEELQEELRELLMQARSRDIAVQATSVGPHREDWQVYCDQRPLPAFASRGQERTAVVALLLLEVSYLQLRRNERPVILLDDVFSELDDAHQEALLHRLTECQVLMTAVRAPSRVQEATVWRLSSGQWRMILEAKDATDEE